MLAHEQSTRHEVNLEASRQQEVERQREAAAWQAGEAAFDDLPWASGEEIPVLDLSLGEAACAASIDAAFRRIGFLYVKNHGVKDARLKDMFDVAKEFHSLDEATKLAYEMDDRGVGYLPYFNRKLPAREKPNLNAALIMKQESGPRNILFEQTQWPTEVDRIQLRVTAYVEEMKILSKKLLRIIAIALKMDPDDLLKLFVDPMFRIRLSHYPKGDRRDRATERYWPAC